MLKKFMGNEYIRDIKIVLDGSVARRVGIQEIILKKTSPSVTEGFVRDLAGLVKILQQNGYSIKITKDTEEAYKEIK